jgi:hypothetical protein
MFVLVTLALVVDSHRLSGMVGRRLDSFRHSLDPRFAPSRRSEAVAAKAPAQADTRRQYQRFIIQSGATIQKIAAEKYGPNTILGMDLIKEFNPEIQNLNRVMPGQELLLVPLSEETLLREQADGSYHFIVGSFYNGGDAQARTRALNNQGYQVKITPSRVSDDLLLQRVEIVGLKNLKEAMHAWGSGLSKEGLAFANRSNEGDRLSQAETAY